MTTTSLKRAIPLFLLGAMAAFTGETRQEAAEAEPGPTQQEANTAEPEIMVLAEGLASQNKDSLLNQIEKYWLHYQTNDWSKLYRMYVDDFRNAMPLQEFEECNRAVVLDYKLKYIKFWGDKCAQVKTSLNMTSEVMPLKNLPLKQYWVLEEGTWKIFEDPYLSRLAPLRKQKPVEPPCTLPQAKETGKSDLNP